MNKSFLRYILTLIVVIMTLAFYIPARYNVRYPREIGPQFDPFYKRVSLRAIAIDQPQMIVLGDSVFMRGVDLDQLAAGTGKTVYGIGVGGSASALWYVVIKNNIVPSPYKPQALMIVFRDTMLTTTGYRVNGSYFKQLDEYATPNDHLLIERSYINLMNPLEKISERYLPLYGSRLSLRETLDYYIRYSGNKLLFGCDNRCTDKAMGIVYGAANMEQNILGDAIGTAEDYLYTPGALDFNQQVNRSFLPEIVRMCRENGIQLVLIRTKTMRYPDEASEPLALKMYMENMSAYLNTHGVILLDFGQDERIKTEYFYDPLHLNEQGRVIFTEMIVNSLKTILH